MLGRRFSLRLFGVSGRSGVRSFASTAAVTGAVAAMKPHLVLINHGYPPLFNAGSEVYTQNLAHRMQAMGQCASVTVAAREQNPFQRDYTIRRTSDSLNAALPVHLINHPREVTASLAVCCELGLISRGMMCLCAMSIGCLSPIRQSTD